MTDPELCVPEQTDRETLGAFAARAVRLRSDALVRLRGRPGDGRPGDGRPGDAETDTVEAWVATPFDALVTRTVAGTVAPTDVTVPGNELLAAVTVAGGRVMSPGQVRDMYWQSELPRGQGWHVLEELPARVVSDLAEKGANLARENLGPRGTPPTSLLDQTVLTVHEDGREVTIPMRCLFAMSGMGFLGGDVDSDTVRVRATDSWLRLDARYGAVVRRRRALLPLLT